ncbi:MAG: ATP synthase F1 subunit delta [Bacteroidetes bacterium]|nr:MAG: ATP synthase F1 subunit delta [Bacteroidota bacterium]
MSDTTIARRYAGALYEEAHSSSAVEATDADVALIRESLEGAPDLGHFFGSPVISREKKESTAKALFAERLQPLTMNFLLLMINKGREQLFPEVVAAYQAMRDEQSGIVRVTARVAHPVDASEEASLISAIEAKTGKTVRLNIEVDTSILGGVVVEIGDTVYDGSFVNQLKTLRERLEEGVYAAS